MLYTEIVEDKCNLTSKIAISYVRTVEVKDNKDKRFFIKNT